MARRYGRYVEPGADEAKDLGTMVRIGAVWYAIGAAVLVAGLIWFVVAAVTGPMSTWSTDDPAPWVLPLAAIGSGLLLGGPGWLFYRLSRRDLRALRDADGQRRRLLRSGRPLHGVVESIEQCGGGGWELVAAIGDPSAKRTRRYTHRYYSVPDEVPAIGEQIVVYVDRADPAAYAVDVP